MDLPHYGVGPHDWMDLPNYGVGPYAHKLNLRYNEPASPPQAKFPPARSPTDKVPAGKVPDNKVPTPRQSPSRNRRVQAMTDGDDTRSDEVFVRARAEGWPRLAGSICETVSGNLTRSAI